jgi:hypothetical protein
MAIISENIPLFHRKIDGELMANIGKGAAMPVYCAIRQIILINHHIYPESQPFFHSVFHRICGFKALSLCVYG